MDTYWAFISVGVGATIRVTVQANSVYEATQMLKAMYGSQLISESAGRL